MKKSILPFLFFFSFLLFPVSPAASSPDSLDEFISHLQTALNVRDRSSFLELFSPELREEQRDFLSFYFDTMEMETVSFYRANKGIENLDRPRLFLQVLYQNAYSSIIETWHLVLEKTEEEWRIKNKDVSGKLTNLYKISLPAERVEKVASIEIHHVDMKLSFDNALVFYDNIPGLETALLILGEGHLSFSPSDPSEKHQLEIIYKRRELEDRLEYAFLRFSNTFFENNIRIEKHLASQDIRPTPAEIKQANSLFMKHYPRSFTIENSLTGELLSFLPQGEEAVFDFRADKIGDLTYIYSPFAEEEINMYNRSEGKFINLYSPKDDDSGRKLFVTFSEKFNIESYEIELDFNPEHTHISAKTRISVTSHAASLDVLKLKFAPELKILRIHDAEGRELFFTQDRLRKILYVYFITPLPKNVLSSIEIVYRGRLEPPSQVTDVLPGPQFNENIRFIPTKFDSYLYSQSVCWYPAPSEDDYFTARLTIIVPPDYTCISNGLLVKQGFLNGMQKVTDIEKIGNSYFVFETASPVKYLSFIVGKFTKTGEKTDSFPIQEFVSAHVLAQRKDLLDDAREVIQFYEELFGPFPFEKLAIVQRLWNTGGGHSPASFIVLNELPRGTEVGLYINPDSPVDLSRWKGYFLAHEIAHQWWGQGVTWATYRDQWLSEGLAQFSTSLYLKMKYNDKTFSTILKKFSKSVEKKSEWGAILLGSRLSFHDFEAYQSIIYNKSSLVLNMLREMLGDEVFFGGLKEFFKTYKFKAASTRNFRDTLEKASGKDLKDFFKGWFESHALPEVRISHSVQRKEDSSVLKVKVDQVRNFFVFPLWIEWWEGKEKKAQTVIVEEKNQEFLFPSKGKPSKVKVNVDKAVPGKFF